MFMRLLGLSTSENYHDVSRLPFFNKLVNQDDVLVVKARIFKFTGYNMVRYIMVYSKMVSDSMV